MLTPVLLLAAVINIGGVLNNYNIDKHPLDIRVKRDASTELRDDASVQLPNQTNDISNRNTTADTAGGEETTEEHEANIDVAYTLEDDLLLNYTGYNETETNEAIEDEDNSQEEKTFDDIVTEVSDNGLIKSDGKYESTQNKATELYQEETGTLINSISEYDNDFPETAANGVKALLINKIVEDQFKEEFDRDDNKNKLDEKHDTEVIKELDDKLTKLKSDDDNKTQKEFANYDNEMFDYKHANILLDIILNLRNNNVNEKEKNQRAKRYAPYGDRSFNASPNNTSSGAGSVRYGINPGYVVNYTGYRAMVPDFNYINKQYTQPYPNNVNLNPSNNYRQNTNYPHYNYSTHYYNQQTNNHINWTNYPTYPINPNPINYNQNYRNYNPNARQNNQPYFYNNSPGYNPGYNPISPYRGNQAPSYDNNSGGINANSFNNYYPMSNSSGNRSDGHQHAAPAAPASNENATVTANTTASPVILGSCFLCGSVGCPKFFRKMGFLCVPLDEE